MNDKVKLILVGVLGALVGAAGAGGYEFMQLDDVQQQLAATKQQKDSADQAAVALRAKDENATKKWGTDLGKLVAAAPVAGVTTPAADPATAAADAAKIIDSARAILAVRDGFRGTLDSARAALDSDFDQLALELGQPTPDVAKVTALLQSLQQNWPNKQQDLQSASHQLLADLGILPPAPKPAAPAAEPALPAAVMAPPTPAK
jgi:hypothetical protein